jgi:hypothetical protein
MSRSAAVAHLVERELPKLEVAGSSPVRRFWSRDSIEAEGVARAYEIPGTYRSPIRPAEPLARQTPLARGRRGDCADHSKSLAPARARGATTPDRAGTQIARTSIEAQHARATRGRGAAREGELRTARRQRRLDPASVPGIRPAGGVRPRPSGPRASSRGRRVLDGRSAHRDDGPHPGMRAVPVECPPDPLPQIHARLPAEPLTNLG